MKRTIAQLVEDRIWHYNRLFYIFRKTQKDYYRKGDFDMAERMGQVAREMLRRKKSWLNYASEV